MELQLALLVIASTQLWDSRIALLQICAILLIQALSRIQLRLLVSQAAMSIQINQTTGPIHAPLPNVF